MPNTFTFEEAIGENKTFSFEDAVESPERIAKRQSLQSEMAKVRAEAPGPSIAGIAGDYVVGPIANAPQTILSIPAAVANAIPWVESKIGLIPEEQGLPYAPGKPTLTLPSPSPETKQAATETLSFIRNLPIVKTSVLGEGLQPSPVTKEAVGGFLESGKEAIEGFTTPENVALLGALPASQAARAGVSSYFLGQMLPAIPETYQAMVAAADAGDVEETYKQAWSMGLTTAMVYGILKHSKRPDVAQKVIDKFNERTPEEIEANRRAVNIMAPGTMRPAEQPAFIPPTPEAPQMYQFPTAAREFHQGERPVFFTDQPLPQSVIIEPPLREPVSTGKLGWQREALETASTVPERTRLALEAERAADQALIGQPAPAESALIGRPIPVETEAPLPGSPAAIAAQEAKPALPKPTPTKEVIPVEKEVQGKEAVEPQPPAAGEVPAAEVKPAATPEAIAKELGLSFQGVWPGGKNWEFRIEEEGPAQGHSLSPKVGSTLEEIRATKEKKIRERIEYLEEQKAKQPQPAPIKPQEVQDADKIKATMEMARGESPRSAAQVAEGKPPDISKPSAKEEKKVVHPVETIRNLMESKGWTYVEPRDSKAIKIGADLYPTLISSDGNVRLALDATELYERNGTVMYGDMSQIDPKRLTLSAIVVDPKLRGKGLASKAMKEFMAAADEAGIKVQGEPVSMQSYAGKGGKPLTTQQLVKWYKSLGFKQAKEGSNLILERFPEKPTTPQEAPVTKVKEPWLNRKSLNNEYDPDWTVPAFDKKTSRFYVSDRKSGEQHFIEPWQMSQSEFEMSFPVEQGKGISNFAAWAGSTEKSRMGQYKYRGKWYNRGDTSPLRKEHQSIVERARNEGKPVPPEVLKEYGLEGKQPVVKRRVGRGITAFDRFNREEQINGPDILSFIANQFGGMLSKSEAKRTKSKEWWKRNQSEYDDAPGQLSSPHHNIIYRGQSTPNVVAQAAYEAGFLKEPYVSDLWDAVARASKGRLEAIRKMKKEEVLLQEEIKMLEDWSKATSEGETLVFGSELKVGDLMEVSGERVEVVKVDPDTGDVLLKDGKKFGVQKINEEQSIYVEKFEEAKIEEDFPEPEPPKKPKTELFTAEETPFNLAGEKIVAPEPKPIEKPSEFGGFGTEKLAQQEMFAINKIVKDVDPHKSAKAASEMYGGPANAIKKIENQLSVINSDKDTRKAFTKEQRDRLREVLNVLQEQASKQPPAAEKVDVAGKIDDALKKLKIQQGGLQAFGVVPLVWNTAVDIVRTSIKAGWSVADAVAKALDYIRSNHKGKWDEKAAQRKLTIAASIERLPIGGVIDIREGTTLEATGKASEAKTGPHFYQKMSWKETVQRASQEVEGIGTDMTAALDKVSQIKDPTVQQAARTIIFERASEVANKNPDDFASTIVAAQLLSDVEQSKSTAGRTLNFEKAVNDSLDQNAWLRAYYGAVMKAQSAVVERRLPGVQKSVKQGLTESGKEASATAPAIVEASKNPKTVNVRNFIKQSGIDLKQVFFEMPETQAARKSELLSRLEADPRFSKLTDAQKQNAVNQLNDTWEQARNAAFRREFRRFIDLPNVGEASKAKVENVVDELIKLDNLGILNNVAFNNALAKKFGLERLDGPLVQKITALTNQAKNAKTQVERNRIQLELKREIINARGLRPIDYIRDAWYGGVLIGFRTMASVASGSGINNLMSSFEQSLLAAVRQGRPDVAYRISTSYFSKLAEGIAYSLDLIRTGDISHLPDVERRIQAFLKDPMNARYNAYEQFFTADKAWKKILAFPALATRLITALDYAASVGTRQGSLMYSSLARGDYASLDASMRRYRAGENAKARQQAIEDLGPNAKRVDILSRQREILEEGISQEIKDASEEIIRINALNADPVGLPGFLYKGLNGLANLATKTAGTEMAGFALKAVTGTAFFKAFINFVSRQTQYFPVLGAMSYARAKVASMPFYKALPKNHWMRVFGLDIPPEQRQLIYAAQVTGLATIAALSYAMLGKKDDEKRVVDITGGWYGLTPAEKSQEMSKRRKPFSLIVNGNYYPFINTPLASALSIVGYLRDQERYHNKKFSEKEIQQHVLDSGLAGLTYIRDMSMVNQLMTTLGLTTASLAQEPDAEKTIGKMLGTAGNVSAGFIPSFAREMETWFDPSTYKPTKGWEYFWRSFPVVRGMGMEPDLDILANPVEVRRVPWQRIVSFKRDEPLYNLLSQWSDKGYFMPAPSRSTEIVGKDYKKRQMEEPEFRQYAKRTGELYKEYLQTYVNNREQLPEDSKGVEVVQRRLAHLRDLARRQVTPVK